jgi:hypothetical protein
LKKDTAHFTQVHKSSKSIMEAMKHIKLAMDGSVHAPDAARVATFADVIAAAGSGILPFVAGRVPDLTGLRGTSKTARNAITDFPALKGPATVVYVKEEDALDRWEAVFPAGTTLKLESLVHCEPPPTDNIFAKLATMSHLQDLNLRLRVDKCDHIAAALPHLRQLTRLDVKLLGLDEDSPGKKELVLAIGTLPALRWLHITGAVADDAEAMSHTLQALAPTLTYLDLQFTHLFIVPDVEVLMPGELGKEEAAVKLAASIGSLSKLRTFTLQRTCVVWESAAHVLATSVCSLPALEELSISLLTGDAFLLTLMDNLKYAPRLQLLDLHDVHVNFPRLTSSLMKMPLLKKLVLSNMKIDADDMGILSKALPTLTALEHLDLRDNVFDIWADLCTTFANMKSLVTLLLNGYMDGPDASLLPKRLPKLAVFSALLQPSYVRHLVPVIPRLQELHLEVPGMDEAMMGMLSMGIAGSANLTFLSLYEVPALASSTWLLLVEPDETGRRLPKLQTLRLNGSDVGCFPFKGFFKGAPNITRLVLTRCHSMRDRVDDLAYDLRSLPFISSVDLRHNGLGAADLPTLSFLLQYNNSISTLFLDDDSITTQDLVELGIASRCPGH